MAAVESGLAGVQLTKVRPGADVLKRAKRKSVVFQAVFTESEPEVNVANDISQVSNCNSPFKHL